MSEIEQLQKRLQLAHGTMAALANAITSLLKDHVRLAGGEPERALMTARQILDESLSSDVEITSSTSEGGARTLSAIQRQAKNLLDQVEAAVRTELGLQRQTQGSH